MYCPLMVDLTNKKVVIFGAGEIALRKANRLQEANLTVVSPNLHPDFQELKIDYIEDVYKEKYLDGAFLVIAATDNKEVNLEIATACKSKGILHNVISSLDASDVIFPSVIGTDGLKIAISTQGAFPSLSKQVRLEMTDRYQKYDKQYLDLLEELRAIVLSSKLDNSTLIMREALDLSYEELVTRVRELKEAIFHYDNLIAIGNDPVNDDDSVRMYMDSWDGEEFMEELELSETMDVLEIGVGTGRLATKVLGHVHTLTGIDLSKQTIEQAMQHLNVPSFYPVVGDFMSYPFGREFDLIYSSLTFMHIREKRKAIEKVFKLLKKGGKFVLSIDKNPSNSIDFGDYKVMIYPDTKEEIVSLLGEVGFKNIKSIEKESAWILSTKKDRV